MRLARLRWGLHATMPDKSYYKLLQVDPSADPDVIAAAHRILAGRLHPETDFTGIQEYRLKELNRAVATLSDPQKRRAYDEELMGGGEEDAAWPAPAASDRVPVGPGHANGPANGHHQGYSLGERLRAQ